MGHCTDIYSGALHRHTQWSTAQTQTEGHCTDTHSGALHRHRQSGTAQTQTVGHCTDTDSGALHRHGLWGTAQTQRVEHCTDTDSEALHRHGLWGTAQTQRVEHCTDTDSGALHRHKHWQCTQKIKARHQKWPFLVYLCQAVSEKISSYICHAVSSTHKPPSQPFNLTSGAQGDGAGDFCTSLILTFTIPGTILVPLSGADTGGGSPGDQDPPPPPGWGTPKLHKEGKIRVCARERPAF